jgi:class 3 adenylate cyclase/predicted ATPase
MTFDEILAQTLDLLQRQGRVSYRALKRRFALDDDYLEDLKAELIDAQRVAADEDGKVLVWSGGSGTVLSSDNNHKRAPLSYTPTHLLEKILNSRAALQGERKQVTVMFADLKGSMELLADRDPEEARRLLDPVLELLIEAVHRYEGTVNQVLGDGIMALFGAPLAHEDHAMRACYAAVWMQDAIGRYAEELRRRQGLDVQIRVGLNSGEVVVRSIGSDLHMDYTAVGQTTHLAARMEQLTRPGTTLMTTNTLRLAEGFIEVTALGPVPVKGLKAPIEIYQLIRARPLRSRLSAAATHGLTRFVGRQVEIEQLQRALERAGGGRGQVVAVIGEPGVGKSRLFYEFIHSHRAQGWFVLESFSVSYGKATAYLPVIDLLKTYFQIADRDETRTIRAKVTGHVLTLDEALRDTIPALLALLEALPKEDPFQSLDPSQRRQRTLDALKRLLLRESQVQPLLAVFENLHWIDSETQAFLNSLIESLPTARLLLLANYRPEYQHAWGSKTYYTQLRLDPLPHASAAELLHALLGDDASLQLLSRLLIDRTAGNPFFLEESVRALVETQVLVGERGAYRQVQPLQTIQVPATVQAVLAARIDRLPADEKRLLQTAAVVGTDFPFPLLQAVAEVPEAELRRSLTYLQAAELIYETRLFPELEYTFKHALTYQVAYESLLQERRRELHTRIMEALEELTGERVSEQVERLAYHALRGEVWDKALTYFHQAGNKAAARSAHIEAISHLTTALDLLKHLPDAPHRVDQELALQTTLGGALMATRGHAAPEVEQAYGRAWELCRQVEETPELCRVLVGLHMFYRQRAELQTSYEVGKQLLTFAQSVQDSQFLLEAHQALGTTLYFMGEFVQAREHLEQGVTLYDPLQHRSHAILYGQDPGVICLSTLSRALWALGYPDQAVQRLQESLALAQQLSHPFSLSFALYVAAVVYQYLQQVQATQEHTEALMALSTEQEFRQRLAQGRILLGWTLVEQGRLAEGIAQMRQSAAAYGATGADLGRSYYLALLAEAYGKGGQAGEGLAVLAEALDAMDEHDIRFNEAELNRLKGELLLRQLAEGGSWLMAKAKPCPQPEVERPGLTEAEACFRQALDTARHQHAKSLELRAAIGLSRLWQQQGKSAAARDLLAGIYGWFTEGFDTVDLQAAKALLETLQ